jgi:hypothetical protein
MGSNFNQEIILPKNLTSFTMGFDFGFDFNQAVELPESLTVGYR